MKILALVLLLPGVSLACGKNEYEYNGECVVDIKPITAAAVVPSDEKPPTDKMPSYQRADVHVVEAPSTMAEDARLDQEKFNAERDGKAAAGIK